MSVYYELKSLNIASSAKMASNLNEVTADEALCSGIPVIAVMTPDEFVSLGVEDGVVRENPWTLVATESNFIDVYPDFIIGSFSIPDFENEAKSNFTFAFYLDKFKLVFVDEGETAEVILEHVVDNGVVKEMSTAHCLYVFMKEMLKNDFAALGSFEDEMACIEEKMMRKKAQIETNCIMRFRRRAMRFGMFYQQVATMATELADNENKMMSQRDAKSFLHISSLADRLTTRAEVLKDYSVQLHELQDTHIDMKQNSIMQVFTIVTVLFAPLTLVTSWYGMNLSILPGEDWDFTWIALIVLALVSTSLLLLWFHRKKWL